MRSIIYCLFLTLVGCGSSSHATKPAPPAKIRSSRHAAAVAEVIASANGEQQATALTAVCDLAFRDGSDEGKGMGLEMKTKYTSAHCIGNVSKEMMLAMLSETGNDTDAVEVRINRLCKRELPRRTSMFGQGLLEVTQVCQGNSLCAVTVQSAYRSCHLAGLKEGIEVETEDTLVRMLETCSTFHSKGSACQTDAQNLMLELRQMVREFQSK